MVAAGLATVTATTALWVVRHWPAGRRWFAGLVSIAVTLTLFSFVGWATNVIVPAVHYLIWAGILTVALLFALRLYRELASFPPTE
jgi:hypothetical protein